MASLTQWTWVWVNSGSWWWTGRPGVLQFMGSHRVRHDWSDLAVAAALYLPLSSPYEEHEQKEGFDGSIAVSRNCNFRWRLAGRSDWSEIIRQFIIFSCLQMCEARSQKVSELWWGLGALKGGAMWSLWGIEEPEHVSLANYKYRWIFSALSDLCSWFRCRIISKLIVLSSGCILRQIVEHNQGQNLTKLVWE